MQRSYVVHPDNAPIFDADKPELGILVSLDNGAKNTGRAGAVRGLRAAKEMEPRRYLPEDVGYRVLCNAVVFQLSKQSRDRVCVPFSDRSVCLTDG